MGKLSSCAKATAGTVVTLFAFLPARMMAPDTAPGHVG